MSPYPRPKVRGTKKTPQKPVLKPLRELGPDDVEIISDAPTAKKNRSKTSTPDREAPRASDLGTSSKSKPVEKSSDPEVDEFVPVVPRIKIITPLRLISCGMVLLIFLGGWWTLHRRAVHQAGLTFAETARSGRAALAKSDYETADAELQKAVRALDLLGRQDREARLVRQLARESAVANGLATSSLFELISESKQAKVMSGDGWQELLKRSNQGAWFLFDTNGIQFDSADVATRTFSVILVPGEEPVYLRSNLSRWAKVLGDTQPSRMIFAGQPENITSAAAGGKGWELVLAPESLVLWTDPEQYAALGGFVDDAGLAILKAQSHMLGLSE